MTRETVTLDFGVTKEGRGGVKNPRKSRYGIYEYSLN